MKDGKTRTLTPSLRFPAFRGKPGWREKPLGEILAPTVRERKKPATVYTGLGVRSHGNGTFLKELAQPDKTSMEVLYEVEPDDLIVNITFAWEGAIAIAKPVDAGALVSHRFPTYLLNRDAALPEFFRYRILDKRFVYNLGVISPGGAGRNRVLNKTDFLKLELAVPEVAEQHKIADCLKSLDELIAAHARKLEALRAHKKGLLQRLFPREGETLPHLRFPEFRDATEWEISPFDKFVLRSFYGTSNATSAKGQYPVLRMGNMVDGGLDLSNLVYIDLDRESFEDIRLKRGDILLNRTNSLDLVGKISVFALDTECITASYIVTYRLDPARIDPRFCNILLNTPQYQTKIKALAHPSVSQANINPTTFRNELVVSVPSPAEQQRVSGCLSSINDSIVAQIQRVSALKTHKKSLMQQLFPSSAEG